MMDTIGMAINRIMGMTDMEPEKNPIVERMRLECYVGYDCYFCGRRIGRLPIVRLQPFRFLSDGSEYSDAINDFYAHPSCAKRAGLTEIGDTKIVRE